MQVLAVLIVFAFFKQILGIKITDAYLTDPERLTKNGYLNEVHTIETSDGYILSVYRILPKSTVTGIGKSPPILLGHGNTGSSTSFIVLGPGKSLGYLLADEGFDVWLINYRGNRYSLSHTIYQSTSPGKYWNFTFHEMGIYDLPAVIDYVLNITAFEKVSYIGYSQGCTVSYVLLSEKPEYNKKIKAQFDFAPSVFMCPSRLTKAFNEDMLEFLYSLDGFKVFPYSTSVHTFIFNFCKLHSWTERLCKLLFVSFFNLSKDAIDEDFPFIIASLPTCAPSKTFLHSIQLFRTCGFCKFMKSAYEKTVNYNLKNVKVPVYVFHGETDMWVPTAGIEHLEREIVGGFTRSISLPHWSHFDFVMAKDAKVRVYDVTIKYLYQIYKN